MAHTDRSGMPLTAGEYIRQLREARNMSIADLQRALGVAWSTVNSWEKKGAVPDRATTALLVERLGLSPEERAGLFEAVNYVTPSTSPSSPTSPRGPTTPASPRAPAHPPSREPRSDAQREAMSDALTKALDTRRHTVMDAIQILDALADGAEAFQTLNDPSQAARAWLDAAATLRARGLPVTAGSLAAVLPEVLVGSASGKGGSTR